jgi:hypothetical protein
MRNASGAAAGGEALRDCAKPFANPARAFVTRIREGLEGGSDDDAAA